VSDASYPLAAAANRRPEPFRMDVERPLGNRAALFVLYGEVDLHVAPELRDRLAQVVDEGTDYVVLDLTRVAFLDSMALGVLLSSFKRVRSLGGQLRVIVPRTSELRRIFEITMLDNVLTLDESRQEAFAELVEPWR
jgi:anti-sigma B factor antagonist